MSSRFPKTLRLRKRASFLRMVVNGARRNATRLFGRYIIVDKCSNTLNTTRLGITVTRQFGKAHDRNRFKRIVREAFRLNYQKIPLGLDLNIKPKPFAKEAVMSDIAQEMLQLLVE